MPDADGNVKADGGTTKTSLHAYKDGRDEDIKGDTEKLLHSEDPKDMQQNELEDEDEEPHAPEKK